jgi:endoglucanase
MPKSFALAFGPLLAASVASLTIGCEVTVSTGTDSRSATNVAGRSTTLEAPLPSDHESTEATSHGVATASPPVSGPMPFRGVNLAGGEFGDVLPGVEDVDYQWPTTKEVDYYLSKGMNTFRIGFKWERIQPQAYGELDPAYAAKLQAIVGYATAQGASVIIEPHNFARYYGVLVGSDSVPSSVFADLWRRLALRNAANPRVMFNLVNEPNTMPTEQWVSDANAAIGAIRQTGAGNTIIVPGNNWTGAHSWDQDDYGTANAKAMLDIVDPADNALFEVHQYLDETSGGVSEQCVGTTVGRERLAPFVRWLREHGKKGFVGEFAGGDNETCNLAVKDMLGAMMDASDVLVGWLWWAAGPAWQGSYPFSLDPLNDGKDRPQMSLLRPHLFPTTAL